MSTRSLTLFLLSVLVTSFSSSCVSNKSVLGHKLALTGAVRHELVPDSDFQMLRKYYHNGNSDFEKCYYRNIIIRRLMLKDDEHFTAWSQQLYGGRALTETTADLATSLMSAFIGASGPSSTKTLGLVLSGISGARLSLDKNIYLEQTVGALISTMQAERANVDTQITQYLKHSVLEYPLEEGLRDIVRYYEAGTLAHASERLSSNANDSARAANARTEYEKGDRKIAPRELNQEKARFFEPNEIPTLKRAPTRPPGEIPPRAPREKADLIELISKAELKTPERLRNESFYESLLAVAGDTESDRTSEGFSDALQKISDEEVLKEILRKADRMASQQSN